MANRPDRPLVVKATLDERSSKRITFSSARNCSYDLLRHKVNQCFSLYSSSYVIEYKDDDGENYPICTDEDLTEAIHYFQAGSDDAPMSSAASILSMRSFSSRKITLKVSVTVEFDGSLSDTSSLRSLNEFRSRNGSELSFSSLNISQQEPEDDAVTVSSRDAASLRRPIAPRHSSPDFDVRSLSEFSDSNTISSYDLRSRSPSANGDSTHSYTIIPREDPFEDTSAPPLTTVPNYNRFSMDSAGASSDNHAEPSEFLNRNAAWLREQNDRAVKSMVGSVGSSSESEAENESVSGFSFSQHSFEYAVTGDLSLERDPRGKYYYTYTGTSQADDNRSISQESESSAFPAPVRPSSMQIGWIQSHQVPHPPQKSNSYPASQASSRASSFPSGSQPSLVHSQYSDPVEYTRHIVPDIPPEVLKFLPLTGPPAEEVTSCSECGVLLDNIRYVCNACGPRGKNSGASNPFDDAASSNGSGSPPSVSSSPLLSHHAMSYPPPGHRSSPTPSIYSQTLSVGPSVASSRHKPLPTVPRASHSLPALTVNGEILKDGYELCSDCIESVGISHAIEAGAPFGVSPSRDTKYASSSEAESALSQWRRSAPRQKGQLRHAYVEKIWGYSGWEDVVQDDNVPTRCSTCNTSIKGKRYKCASCSNFTLCRGCYSQVHDLHPSHAFLVMPDKPTATSPSETESPVFLEDHQEKSMVHTGIKCAHCMLDIVGARFHCVICPSVDICDQCESAGLTPVDDADHNSSHILIKIPYPLESNEVQNASQRAINLWRGRDAASLGYEAASSEYGGSSYARTEVGSSLQTLVDDHGVACDACRETIRGLRYECINCPSLPKPYSLCRDCERRSYQVHDPMHAFFKLPRPVHRPIELPDPALPVLYKTPVGPRNSASQSSNFAIDPTAYLREVVHSSAVCDRCMTLIRGPWFRCVFCPKDLCDSCEELDAHDDTHVFLIFKSAVDMSVLRRYTDLEDPRRHANLLPHKVYVS